jgi:hypothetical protein
MTHQLDLFSYRPPTEEDPHGKDTPAAIRERTKNTMQLNKLFFVAIDNLEIALDAIRQAQDLACSDLERPESRISHAIYEIWDALEAEQQLQ